MKRSLSENLQRNITYQKSINVAPVESAFSPGGLQYPPAPGPMSAPINPGPASPAFDTEGFAYSPRTGITGYDDYLIFILDSNNNPIDAFIADVSTKDCFLANHPTTTRVMNSAVIKGTGSVTYDQLLTAIKNSPMLGYLNNFPTMQAQLRGNMSVPYCGRAPQRGSNLPTTPQSAVHRAMQPSSGFKRNPWQPR